MAGFQFSRRYISKIIKPLLIWVVLIYILLQMTVIFKNSGTVVTPFTKRATILPVISDITNFKVTSAVRAQVDRSRDDDSELAVKVLTRMVTRKVTPSSQIVQEVYDPIATELCRSDVRLLRGYQRKTKSFLTIGLTTVPRENDNYLPATLKALWDKLSPEERDAVVIVLFIGSMDENFTNDTLKMIDNSFPEAVAKGTLQVIQPHPYVYPDFNKIIKRTFNDSMERVHWRTKQNIDFATLFSHSANLSQYYIHVEDDVIAANGYLGDIKNLLDRVNSPSYKKIWFELDFSTLGFIGRLYRSADLCLITKFLLLFQLEKPCDILINDLKHVMMQQKDIRSPKSLFQHVGKTSSLKGKVQNLTDRNFKDLRRRGRPIGNRGKGNVIERDLLMSYKHSLVPNPMPSRIVSNMETFGDYTPERGYFSFEKGFFWAKAPEFNSSYRVEYNVTTNVDAITIRTGHPKKFIDMLENGKVRISLGNTSHDPDDCGKFRDVGKFDKGQFYVHFNDTMDLKCMEVVVTEKMKTWLIIAEINVDTESEAEEVGDEDSKGHKNKR